LAEYTWLFESCQNSPTSPQHGDKKKASAVLIERKPGLTRASHLSRLTRYSKTSAAEVYPKAGDNFNLGPQIPT
jgi:hypothetical protein